MKQARGFSLIEVIAAMLLLAIAFAALMQVAGGAMRLAHDAADYDCAALYARSLLDGAFVLEPLVPGRRSGRFDDQYSWQLDVTPWNDGQPRPPGSQLQLYRLDLTVSWGAPPRPRIVHFDTLRLGLASPAPVESAP